jgi:hypothetical protein
MDVLFELLLLLFADLLVLLSRFYFDSFLDLDVALSILLAELYFGFFHLRLGHISLLVNFDQFFSLMRAGFLEVLVSLLLLFIALFEQLASIRAPFFFGGFPALLRPVHLISGVNLVRQSSV